MSSKVWVCTHTEGDFDFTGRVFSSRKSGLCAFERAHGQYFLDYDATSAEDMEAMGFIIFEEREIEVWGEL